MPIGEFSERSGLSAKRLRTYAAEGLLVPAAVDSATGYRYYSPGQLSAAQLIDALRQAGMPLGDIRAFLRQPSDAQLDAWAQRLDVDATQRQRGLMIARRLLAGLEPASTYQSSDGRQEVPRMMMLQTAGQTETGPIRATNQDVIVATERLAVVADGMGGAPNGELAANAVAGALTAAFTGQSADELQAAIRAANWAIWDRAAADPALEGMGTTVCAIGLLQDGPLAIVHVGDSRAYLWRDQALRQLTRDHSVTAELVRCGDLREEEARGHPHYGVLTRALGVAPEVEIDSAHLAVEVGDRIIVCSDGLLNELPNEEIVSALTRAEDVGSMAEALVRSAVEHGGRDNVSVVVADIAA
jgi:PPM family protein phosphatase